MKKFAGGQVEAWFVCLTLLGYKLYLTIPVPRTTEHGKDKSKVHKTIPIKPQVYVQCSHYTHIQNNNNIRSEFEHA